MSSYAGIGARKTPAPILNIMQDLATMLSELGYILRSGGAEGADSAFEAGSFSSQIFLPWDGFNGKKIKDSVSGGSRETVLEYLVPSFNEGLVKRFHPKSSALSSQGLALMSRNSYQVLGSDLRSPSDFVICWTPEGKKVGGTSQAMRIASFYNIKVYNLAIEKDHEDLMTMINFNHSI